MKPPLAEKDSETWNRVANEFYIPIRNSIAAVTKHSGIPMPPEAIATITFVKAIRASHTLRDIDKLLPWLRTIAWNEVYRAISKNKHDLELVVPEADILAHSDNDDDAGILRLRGRVASAGRGELGRFVQMWARACPAVFTLSMGMTRRRWSRGYRGEMGGGGRPRRCAGCGWVAGMTDRAKKRPGLAERSGPEWERGRRSRMEGSRLGR